MRNGKYREVLLNQESINDPDNFFGGMACAIKPLEIFATRDFQNTGDVIQFVKNQGIPGPCKGFNPLRFTADGNAFPAKKISLFLKPSRIGNNRFALKDMIYGVIIRKGRKEFNVGILLFSKNVDDGLYPGMN